MHDPDAHRIYATVFCLASGGCLRDMFEILHVLGRVHGIKQRASGYLGLP